MANKAQIELTVQEIEWAAETNVFDVQTQAHLQQWISTLPLRDLRLKIDPKTPYYLALNNFLLQHGLAHTQISTFAETITRPTNTVFIAGIIINRHISHCPSWRVPNMADSNVSQSSNFGCANEHNLAIMVADPSDLIRGKELDPASAEHTSNALNRYYRRTIEQAEAEAAADPLTAPVISAQ